MEKLKWNKRKLKDRSYKITWFTYKTRLYIYNKYKYIYNVLFDKHLVIYINPIDKYYIITWVNEGIQNQEGESCTALIFHNCHVHLDFYDRVCKQNIWAWVLFGRFFLK